MKTITASILSLAATLASTASTGDGLQAHALAMLDEPQTVAQSDTAATDSVEKFVFTDVLVLPHTSVKDQNKSGTCWCFAGTSFFENEILKNTGDTVDISEMFTVRQCYLDKADRYIRMNGTVNFAEGGSIMDIPYVWRNYGAIPEEVYSGLNYGSDKHDHAELSAAISAYLSAINTNPGKKITTAWRRGLEGILDAYFGPVPQSFEYKGRTYTPATYAQSLGLDMDRYVPLTSFSHHPYYQAFPLEVPDNWLWEKYYNIPLEDLKATVDRSLEKGHTVVWAADVSEGGFKWKDGVALMPRPKDEADMEGTELSKWVVLSDNERRESRFDFKGPVEEIEVTSESRQQDFDNRETTDDHGMEIVGIARDQKGNRYYKVKNSWDTNQVYGGYLYVSEPYFLAKTLSILVNADVLDRDTADKLGIRR